MIKTNKKNIVIFRVGSIGDTLVSIPSLRLIQSAFPDSTKHLLTNLPLKASIKEKASSEILEGSGLVDSYVNFPSKQFGFNEAVKLFLKIKKMKTETLIYLMPSRTRMQLARDWFFFKLCGVKNLIGLKFDLRYQYRQFKMENGKWQSEAERLLSLIAELGNKDLTDPEVWKLDLSNQEVAFADDIVAKFSSKPYIVFSIGTKVDSNDWGEDRWIDLSKNLSNHYPEYSLILLGSSDEFEVSTRIVKAWHGESLNLCGKVSIRVSGAIIKKSSVFIGHNSGPIHLAASVNASIVGIFSGSTRPGEWFPLEAKSTIIYKQLECFGCGLQSCHVMKKECIRSITVDEVIDATNQYLI